MNISFTSRLSIVVLVLITSMASAQPSAPGDELSWEDRTTQTLMAKISDWAGTWQAQLPDLYIAHYALDYIAPGFASRQAWLADRRQRLVEPEYI